MIYVGLAWAQSWVLKLKSLGLCWAATWELGVTEAPSRTRFIASSTIFIEIFSRNMERRRPGQVSKVCKKWVSLKATCSEEKKLDKKSSWAFFKCFQISRWILILNNFIGAIPQRELMEVPMVRRGFSQSQHEYLMCANFWKVELNHLKKTNVSSWVSLFVELAWPTLQLS